MSMHLTAHERDRLLVSAAADLARRRLARGARLGATEAAALITDEVMEWAWDGLPLAEVVQRSGTVLTREQVLPGVPAKVRHLLVDALFPSGTLLVDVVDPIADESWDALEREQEESDRTVELNVGRARREVTVTNRSDRVIRVTSHIDFACANPLLTPTQPVPAGWRPDIPAGSNVAVAPRQTATIPLVAMAARKDGE
ncbi:MAG: urease subunit gamma [Pedococcus sp.]